MATVTISVRFAGDHNSKYGSLESGHFVTNLSTEYFPSEVVVNIVNEQIMPQVFTAFRVTASGYDRGAGGWSFNVDACSDDVKKSIKSFAVGDEWNVTIEVEAPADFSA